ncbi:hypothetical protein NKI86_31715 [Mesorhizobium sp. M0320]|uniref:hypothetical protein n=1 Tax=Mesorhizobium sp. M0320 TaxID=2956936 RepID=UPI003336B449
MIFTPFESQTSGRRLLLKLSPEDKQKWDSKPRRSHMQMEVTDQTTGRRLVVRSASCGAGCYCAAEVVREIPTGSTEALHYHD